MSGAPGVLFDVDGTLLDSNYLHVIAWHRALRDAGHHEVLAADVHRVIGIASDGLLERLIGRTDDRIAQGHADHFRRLRPEVRPFPRAAALVRRCHRAGLTVVLATSGAGDDLEWMLPAIGADGAVDGTVTADDVEAGKPAPDLLGTAVRTFRLDPERTVAVGDTVWDVEAAERAGVPSIALTAGGLDEGVLRSAGAAEVHDSPAALLQGFDDSLLGRLARR